MAKRLVFQFKITLTDVEPAIWRRIQISERCTFWDLHLAVQDAMGWADSHLHEFQAINPITDQKERIGIFDAHRADLAPILPGWDLFVKDYLTLETNHTLLYRYDFESDWNHRIEFENHGEKQPKKYPICLAGERACPPEEIGGRQGYAYFLAAVKNPKHEEHVQYLEWVGGTYDPEKFNPQKVRFRNPKTTQRKVFTENVEFL